MDQTMGSGFNNEKWIKPFLCGILDGYIDKNMQTTECGISSGSAGFDKI